MGSGKWGVGSGEWGVRSGEWGLRSGEWGVGIVGIVGRIWVRFGLGQVWVWVGLDWVGVYSCGLMHGLTSLCDGCGLPLDVLGESGHLIRTA